MKLEKRKANRVVLSVPVQFKVFQLDRLEKDIHDPTLLSKAELQDVSLSGLQIVSPTAFREGDVMELELEVPGKGKVRSVAKVVWCEKNGSSEDYRSGIRFIPVYEEDLKKLEDFLKGQS